MHDGNRDICAADYGEASAVGQSSVISFQSSVINHQFSVVGVGPSAKAGGHFYWLAEKELTTEGTEDTEFMKRIFTIIMLLD